MSYQHVGRGVFEVILSNRLKVSGIILTSLVWAYRVLVSHLRCWFIHVMASCKGHNDNQGLRDLPGDFYVKPQYSAL